MSCTLLENEWSGTCRIILLFDTVCVRSPVTRSVSTCCRQTFSAGHCKTLNSTRIKHQLQNLISVNSSTQCQDSGDKVGSHS